MEEDQDDSAPRFRLRGTGGNGTGQGGRKRGTRGARTKGPSSEHEDAADDEAAAAWLRELEERSPADLRDAFGLKPCSPKELRQLPDNAFLGGRKTPGALPIYDPEGKVSLQFLLASYKASEKSRERLRGEDSAVDLHRPFLRWLMKKARELKLLNSREVRRGALAQQRLEAATKSGEWRLSLEQNQAEASDEEVRQKQEQKRQKAAEKALRDATIKMELNFPQPKAATPTAPEGATALLKERLSRQLESKKDKIDALSSHGQDLQTMADRLMAPSLSFDWDEPESDEDDNSKGILQVDLPAAANPQGRRALLREQIQRSVSFKQAKELSKTKSLSSNGSMKSDIREAATPSKKRKTARTVLSDATEPERSDRSQPADLQDPGTSATEGGAPTDSKSSPLEGQPASASAPSVDFAGVASEAAEKAADPPSDDICPAPTGENEAEAEGRSEVQDEGAAAAVSAAGGVEISPTLQFVAEEPEVPGDGLEISPTLPFDIDASALQEACGVEDAAAAPAAAAPAAPPAAEEAAPAEEMDAEEPSSEEDEEIKADTRLVRERAWLRHKRQMQAAQGQEDDDEAFGPVGRAPKRRAKASILMGAV